MNIGVFLVNFANQYATNIAKVTTYTKSMTKRKHPSREKTSSLLVSRIRRKLELWVVMAEVGHPFKPHFLPSFMLMEAECQKVSFHIAQGE